jgi:hypothetical protein
VGWIWKQWQRHFLIAEGTTAVLAATIITVFAWLPQTAPVLDSKLEGNRTNIYRTTAAISGSLLGFSLTISTLVLGHWDSPRLTLIRKHNRRTHEIWTTLRQTTWLLALVTIISIVAIALDTDKEPFKPILTPFLILLGLMMTRLGRAIWIIHEISKTITTGSQSDR